MPAPTHVHIPHARRAPSQPTFEGRRLSHPDEPVFDQGLVFDVGTSIFPACYAGRWPHIHFEIFPSLESATDDANKIATSQVALPKDTCDQVYATTGYEQSVQNLAGVSLARDNVFAEDGGARQLGAIAGSIDAGLSVDLSVPVNA